MGLRSRFKAFRLRRYHAWLERRIPASNAITLNRNNLFILPSKFGLSWLVLVIVLLLLGNNYQNNLVSMMALLMLSIWLLCLVLCHQNLSGLRLRLKQHPEALQGQLATIQLGLESKLESRAIAVELSLPKPWASGESQQLENELSLSFKAKHRGVFVLPRLRLQSVYPLGLFRCWSQLSFNTNAVFYPAPLAGFDCPAHAQLGQGDQSASSGPLMDEFSGLHAYRAGDRMSHIAWKQFAAGRPMQRKDFSSRSGGGIVLSQHQLRHIDYEQSLQVLSFWALRLNQQSTPFSIELAGQTLAMGSGSRHLVLAQRALARAPKR